MGRKETLYFDESWIDINLTEIYAKYDYGKLMKEVICSACRKLAKNVRTTMEKRTPNISENIYMKGEYKFYHLPE